MAVKAHLKRRYFAPEVIRTSDPDGGPAALTALLRGFGLPVSYDIVRAACRSGVEPAAHDALADAARRFGLQCQRSVTPLGMACDADGGTLPAIAMVRSPEGPPQRVLVWRARGDSLQIMDPTLGRRWIPRRRLVNSLLVTESLIDATARLEILGSKAFCASLRRRMRELGEAARLWDDLAHQDAALQFGLALRDAGRLRRGRDTQEFLGLCARHPDEIPREFWSLPGGTDADGRTLLRGTVLLVAAEGVAPSQPGIAATLSGPSEPELAPAVWKPVLAALRQTGFFVPFAVGLAWSAAAGGTVIEALLFRSLFDLGRHLQDTAGRIGLVTAVLVFLGCVMALDWPAVLASLWLGRRLETRLRVGFMLKLPRLGDSYFQSRLISDLAARVHWLQLLRLLPETVGSCLHFLMSLTVTGAAIAWLYPGSGLLAFLAVLAACVTPAVFFPEMTARDLTYREHSAALGSTYLDCLMGSRAIQAHGAEQSVQTAHDYRLGRWAAAALRQQVVFVRSDVAQMLLTFACISALIYQQARIAASPAGLLLLVYWATSIPLQGQELSRLIHSLPAMRNTLLRFLEVVASADERAVAGAEGAAVSAAAAVAINLTNVSICIDDRMILEDVSLRIAAGEHVAIVGASGAGKSSLLGTLLGWYVPARGTVEVDGQPLDFTQLARLREVTAWVDPQVHLFRASLFSNLGYGSGRSGVARIAEAIKATELESVLQNLPDGLQAGLGEGGTLVSGGEGQRIRAGRALCRGTARLAILDEPARGLARQDRRRLLGSLRRRFAGATVLCVTHDIADTADFDRIVVIEQGRIVEQGRPQELRANPVSRYSTLIQEEHAVLRDVWAHPRWRRVNLQAGALHEVRPSETDRENRA